MVDGSIGGSVTAWLGKRRGKVLSSHENVASMQTAQRGGGSMVRVHAQPVSTEKALVDRAELQRLIDVARRVEEVELIEVQDDLPTEGLMRLVQEGGSFSYLADPREDVYTLSDWIPPTRTSARPA
jgi:hypothetical protein